MTKDNEHVEDDPRVEEVLTELHSAATAKFVEVDGEKYSAQDAVAKGLIKLSDIRGYVYPLKDRIAAAKTFLDFTKQKPTQKTDVTVGSHEDFLKSIADEEEQDGDDQGDESSREKG